MSLYVSPALLACALGLAIPRVEVGVPSCGLLGLVVLPTLVVTCDSSVDVRLHVDCRSVVPSRVAFICVWCLCCCPSCCPSCSRARVAHGVACHVESKRKNTGSLSVVVPTVHRHTRHASTCQHLCCLLACCHTEQVRQSDTASATCRGVPRNPVAGSPDTGLLFRPKDHLPDRGLTVLENHAVCRYRSFWKPFTVMESHTVRISSFDPRSVSGEPRIQTSEPES